MNSGNTISNINLIKTNIPEILEITVPENSKKGGNLVFKVGVFMSFSLKTRFKSGCRSKVKDVGVGRNALETLTAIGPK